MIRPFSKPRSSPPRGSSPSLTAPGPRSLDTEARSRVPRRGSKVQAQLREVHAIIGADFAFTAVLFDGSVVTWGDEASGADSSHVQQDEACERP